jgi:hypothetical protein
MYVMLVYGKKKKKKLVKAHTSCVLALNTVRDFMGCHRINDDVQSATPTWSKL